MSDHSQSVLETFVKSFSCKKPDDDEFEEFCERLHTFIEGQKWVSRPLSMSPSVCARYGWKCISPNLLECVTCGVKLCTQEPKIEVYEAYKACIEKVLSDLRESHKTDCPWPLAPSPESFVKMAPVPKEEALNQFIQRLEPCLQFECTVPHVKDSISSEIGLTKENVKALCMLAKISLEDVHLIGISVVCLAATGWSMLSKKNGESKTYIKCENCQRLIWIKAFNIINTLDTEEPSTSENGTITKNRSESSNSDSDNESPRKRIKLDKVDFDPLEEHRPWCLWITSSNMLNGVMNNNSPKGEKVSSLPGWKIFMKSLLRNLSDSQDTNSESSPTKEHLMNVRSLLDSWSSPTL